MARKTSPARLVIALSVAAVLAVFLLYTSIAGGGGTPSVAPSELAARSGEVSLAGRVVGAPTGDPHGAGLRFTLEDIEGTKKERVTVLYKGSVPDLFRPGRELVVTGTQHANGMFVTTPGSMITKCPSKYQSVEPPAA